MSNIRHLDVVISTRVKWTRSFGQMKIGRMRQLDTFNFDVITFKRESMLTQNKNKINITYILLSNFNVKIWYLYICILL
jgi:hypothetical protein